MTIFDAVVLGIISVSGLIGFSRGLIKEVTSLLALALGVLGALKWGRLLVHPLLRIIENSLMANIIGHAVVFFVILVLLGMINKSLSLVIRATGFGFADRSLGAMFGFLRGTLIVVVLAFAASFTRLPQEPWWQQSELAPLVWHGVVELSSHLPDHLPEQLPPFN